MERSKTSKRTSRSLPRIMLHKEAEKNPLRRRQIDEMELENLKFSKIKARTTRAAVGDRAGSLEIEFRRRQEELRLQQQQREQELRLQQQPQQELCLKLQQQEDELRLRQHERARENERKEAEVDEEQRRLEIELTKGSSRASRSQEDNLESVESRRKLAGWAELVAQQSSPSRPLSPNVVTDPYKNVTQDRWQTLQHLPENYHFVPAWCKTFLNATAKFEYPKKTRNP